MNNHSVKGRAARPGEKSCVAAYLQFDGGNTV